MQIVLNIILILGLTYHIVYIERMKYNFERRIKILEEKIKEV